MLLKAKISPPKQGVVILRRARLLERLMAGRSRKVTLLEAPAGFGKTTLLAQISTRARSLDLLGARAGVELKQWGIYIWGRNLTNERYYEDYNPARFSGLPYDIGSLAEPRTYGLEMTAHF